MKALMFLAVVGAALVTFYVLRDLGVSAAWSGIGAVVFVSLGLGAVRRA